MSIRTRVLGMVDVFMRVPPLFVIDEILKISMGLPSMSQTTPAASTPAAVVTSSAAGADMEATMLDSFVHGAFEAFNETLNATLGGGTGAEAAAAGLVTEEYVKVLSLTTLKFLTCLIGKSRQADSVRGCFILLL